MFGPSAYLEEVELMPCKDMCFKLLHNSLHILKLDALIRGTVALLFPEL